MKKILFCLTIFFISLGAMCQDSTYTFSIKSRLVQAFVEDVHDRTKKSIDNDDTLFTYLYHAWIELFKPSNYPNGTAQVSVPGVSIKVIKFLYRQAQNFPQGAAPVLSDMQADVLGIRNASPYLDSQLDLIDAEFDAIVPDKRDVGRRLLRGKTN